MLIKQKVLLLIEISKKMKLLKTLYSKNEAVKNTVYHDLVRKFNAIQTKDTSNLVKKADYDTKIK